MNKKPVLLSIWGALLLLLSSCLGIPHTQEVRRIDALNSRAAYYAYISLDSVQHYATQAYEEAKNYDLGKAEACNNLGFYAFMKMDFEGASQKYEEVYQHSINELELLIADVGRMKICQRTAQNKLFYDYRNRALARMKRINEDRSVFDSDKDKERLDYAFSEFHLVSTIYYYYLQQAEAAAESMRALEELKAEGLTLHPRYGSISQRLYYRYIKGATETLAGRTATQRMMNSFEELYQAWQLARKAGISYVEANAAQGMANILARPHNYQTLVEERYPLLAALELPLDEHLSYRLGQEALQLFEAYKDLYQIAGAHVTLARYYNYQGRYTEALGELEAALAQVNKHHRSYYQGHHDIPDDLVSMPTDTGNTFTELNWMYEGVLTVPEWIARIREQLSVSYAGLGNKAASDYNRNLYLDILDLIRQDKELESRYTQLKQEELFINSLLFALLVLVLVAGALFFWVNRRSRQKTEHYLQRLERSLELCRELTASLPLQSQSVHDILSPLLRLLRQFLEQELEVKRIYLRIKLHGESEERIEDTAPQLASSNELRFHAFELNTSDSSLEQGYLRVYTQKKLSREEVSFVAILTPYLVWGIENGLNFLDLGEERDLLEKKLYIAKQHNQELKRENLLKRATMRVVYGIQPYLDRMRNEVHKLLHADYSQEQPLRQSRYQYIDELLATIQEHNDVLAYWIKIKQGELKLQITSFELSELFELLAKGKRSFEQQEIELHIRPTDACVKADKALTLFMLNTLLENARKFSPAGGQVQVVAVQTPDYVELAVSDTGVGLSAEDLQLLLREKVYDSKAIGQSNPKVKAQKGSGFGLMNCKAIIEKYRKLNPLFEVCRFDIESELGKGSRFSFRLPYGVKKMLGLVLVFLASLWAAPTSLAAEREAAIQSLRPDSSFYQQLQEISDLADAAYFSNKDQTFEQTLHWIEQAIAKLNAFYLEHSYEARAPLMRLNGEGEPAEKIWWQEGFDTNYYLILDLRNEAAVAYLALKELDPYNYNNRAYTSLYMLLSKDDSLDRTCKLIARSTSNKRMAFFLLIGLLAAFLVVYYLVYIRRRLLRRWSLEQVLEVNERIFSSSLRYAQAGGDTRTEADLSPVPHYILSQIFDQINELKGVDGLAISLYDEEKQCFNTSFYPHAFAHDEKLLRAAFQTREWQQAGTQLYIPLETKLKEEAVGLGVFVMHCRDLKSLQAEKLFLDLIVRYLSTVLYHTLIRTAVRFRDIGLVFDEMHRLEWESNQIHVQNRVLDNCLSALKHETIYYPSRLKQLVGRLRSEAYSSEQERAELQSMADLVEYYKGIYSLLSLWGKEVLKEATFRRSTFPVARLEEFVQTQFERRQKKLKSDLRLDLVVEEGLELTGDQILVEYLLQLLLFDALAVPLAGRLEWEIKAEGEFIAFRLTDPRRNFSEEELNQLFYPSLAGIQTAPEEGLAGTSYLLAKEIIREHDEFVGRRGCRIRAYSSPKAGYTLYFTLNRKPQIV